MSRSQRRKGQVGEREAVAALKKIGCLKASRRVRNSAGDSDIIDAIKGVSFECKLEKVQAIAPAMRQAIDQADGALPAVVHRQTVGRGQPANPWCITVRLEDLPMLLHLYRLEMQDAEAEQAVAATDDDGA